MDPDVYRTPDAPDPQTLPARPAEPGDVDALARLWDTAFPGERSAEDRAESLQKGTDPHGGRESCWVLEDEASGNIIGGVRLYRLTMYLFGQPVPTMGLGALAIDPAHRGQGLGSALVRRALKIARDRGDLLSVLFPMHVGFYKRLGYMLAGELHRYRFAPEALPPFPGAEGVRVLSPEERQKFIPELYDELVRSGHGLVARESGQWAHLEDPECVAAVLDDPPAALVGRIRAPAAESGDGSGNNGSPQLHVTELLAFGTNEYRVLLGWLARQEGVWSEIIWDALPGEVFAQVLDHPATPGSGPQRGLWFESASLLRGPMIRILNLPGLVGRLGVEVGANIAVHDPDLPENTGHWTAARAPAGDSIGVHLERDSTDLPPGAMPISLLSSLVVSGTLSSLALASRDFEAAMGISDFRLWDVF